jgi:hypothetical protein
MPSVRGESTADNIPAAAFSLDDLRREGREEWLRKYRGKTQGVLAAMPRNEDLSKTRSDHNPGLEGDIEE